ncbi:MAG: hypothetical protein ACKOB6_07730, partial [Candidatus Kapaibacterium sp.]
MNTFKSLSEYRTFGFGFTGSGEVYEGAERNSVIFGALIVGADCVRSNIASFFELSFFTRGSNFGVARSLDRRERLRTGPLPRERTMALAADPLEGAGMATTFDACGAGALGVDLTTSDFFATTFFATTFFATTFYATTFFAT